MAEPRQLSYRELVQAARERLGSAAANLKTRAELLEALGLAPPSQPAPTARVDAPRPALVTRDFFIARKP